MVYFRGFFIENTETIYRGIVLLPFCCFLDCAVYLGLIEPEDLGKFVNGDIEEGGDEEDELCIKITLELLNLLTTMYSVRKEGTGIGDEVPIYKLKRQ